MSVCSHTHRPEKPGARQGEGGERRRNKGGGKEEEEREVER